MNLFALHSRRAASSTRIDRVTARRRKLVEAVWGLEALESRQLLAAIANPDIYVALEAVPLNVPAPGVLGNDSSTAGAALTVSGYTQPADGILTVAPDGSFRYAPNAGFTGADQFTYMATDAQGATARQTVRLQVNATTDEASVFAGPRLAEIDSTRGALLNTVLGGLVGTNLNLSAVDYNGLADGSINGGKLAAALGTELGVTPAQALTTNASLLQVVNAAATVAQADGNTAEASALRNLATTVAPITGTLRLGDLIQASPNDGSLAASSINALDLVTGAAQLFNFQNVATTPTPITVSGSSLGLPGLVGTVAISAQVVEPPVITVGPTGTAFHTAAVRLATTLNLVNDNLDTTGLVTALQGALPANTTTASASLGQLSVYTEVAEGQGIIASIDAIAQAVTLQATPGLANVYVGSIDPGVFFDRTHAIDPATDLTYGTVGNLDIATGPTPATSVNVPLGIQIRGVALGAAPTATTEVFNAPFPQSQTVSTGATFLTNLANTLASSLDVRLTGAAGTALDPLVNTTILPVVRPLVTDAVTPLLAPTLSGAVNPLLQQLGTGIGQLDLTVAAINQVGAPAANPDTTVTREGQAVVVPVLANDAAVPGDTIGVASVTQPAHGTAVIDANGAVIYTPGVGYYGPDAFNYIITDPGGQTSIAAVAVTVLPTLPTTNPDTLTARAGQALTIPAATGVLANDTDDNRLPLSATLVTGPSHGSLTLGPDGVLVYTPAVGFAGTDSFTYQATDSNGPGNTATVTIDVVATAPAALPDAYTVASGQALAVPAPTGVLSNDADNNGLPLGATLLAGPDHGTLALGPDGSLIYTPTAGYVGPDSFIYEAVDSLGISTAVPVTINVTPAAAGTGGGTGTTDPTQKITSFPITGTQGVPITNVPVATFTDGTGVNDPGSYTATIDYGDGTAPTTGTVTEANGLYLVSGSHTFAQSGTFPVSVVITRPGSNSLGASTSAVIASTSAVGPTGPSISGTVYLDANHNGRDDGNEFGIANVVLTLTGTTTTGVAVRLTSTTDGNGFYGFSGLAAGTYQVRITLPTSVFIDGHVSVGTAGGTVRREAIRRISIGSPIRDNTVGAEAIRANAVGAEAVLNGTGYDFAELIRGNCRLSTSALRALLKAGPTGALPPSFRGVAIAANSPLARYLPTLVARASVQAATSVKVGAKVAHPANHATTSAVHTKVAVKHGKPKGPAVHRGR